MENIFKRLIIFSFLSIVICTNCFSQKCDSKLSGVVLDSETGQPIQYATVFLAYTTLGSLTNEKGEYSITNISAGNYDVVCASVGYEKSVRKTIIRENESKNFDFKLTTLPIQVNEIKIDAKEPVEWKRNYMKFKKEFLGESWRSEQCEITNPEVIDFQIRDEILIASSKSPIYVINEALGYKITFYIKEFCWSLNTDEGKVALEPFFEEIEGNEIPEVNIWRENRMQAYSGSFRHFLKSCAENKVYEQGYRLYEFKESEWNERPTVTNTLRQSKKSLDTLLTHILLKDSETQFSIESNNTLAVLYTKEGEESNYLGYKFRVYKTVALQSFQSSYLKLDTGSLSFNKEGNITDRAMFNIEFTGYWAWKRVSDLLPYNYYPNN